jgi:uncharacterized membrane protein
MQNVQKTRFLAANYSNLQGLKSVPLGLLLLIVVMWANMQKGTASDFTLPIFSSIAMLVLVMAIERYYLTRFGKVDRTFNQKRMEIILGVLGGIVGLVAFLLDTRFDLPVSLIGLIFAGAVVAEYLRMQWYAPGNYLLPLSATSFVILLVVSILPLLGAEHWWQMLGLHSQLFGMLIVAGIVMVIYGLIGHWFFVRQLPGSEK